MLGQNRNNQINSLPLQTTNIKKNITLNKKKIKNILSPSIHSLSTVTIQTILIKVENIQLKYVTRTGSVHLVLTKDSAMAVHGVGRNLMTLLRVL